MVQVVFLRGLGSDEVLRTGEICDDATVGTLNCILRSKSFLAGPTTIYCEEGPTEGMRSFRSTQTDAKLYPHGIPDGTETFTWRIVLSTEDVQSMDTVVGDISRMYTTGSEWGLGLYRGEAGS